MGSQLLNDLFLRQRSEELQIPFENLLLASVLEEIVQRIAESDYADSIWLKNSVRLNRENYRNKVEQNLSFFIHDSRKLTYKKSEVSKMFAELFRNLKKDAVHWNYTVWVDRTLITVDMVAKIASVPVPVRILFEQVRIANLVPYSRDLKLFIHNSHSVRILCYPSEYLLTEKIVEIIEKLELINDVSCYMEAFCLLKKEALSGRTMCELLRESCRKHQINIEENRIQMLLSYRNQGYMKKKWRAFLRREQRKSPSWEEVMDVLEQFLTRLWEHLCRNLIYIGDWMPELGRFLD